MKKNLRMINVDLEDSNELPIPFRTYTPEIPIPKW